MRRNAKSVALLTTFVVAVAWAATTRAGLPLLGAKAAPKSPVAWQKDLKAAQQLSEKSGRPMLIVFGADWCTHCGKFEETTLGNPTMASYINKEFVPVHLDYDQEEKTAQILEVEAIPCTVILSPQADLLGKVVGAKPPKDFWEALQDARDEQTRVKAARIAGATPGTKLQ